MKDKSIFPDTLNPGAVEIFMLDGKEVAIPKCGVTFKRWAGTSIKETFGGKPLVDVGGKPMFAELAIMHLFIDSGWQARWVETYAKNNQKPIFLSEWKDDRYKNQISTPITDTMIARRLEEVATLNNGSYFGCWDVVGWHDGRILFAESKRLKKDRIRDTQTNWLNVGLHSGLARENFLVVQWKFA
jgi:hypothetical protein